MHELNSQPQVQPDDIYFDTVHIETLECRDTQAFVKLQLGDTSTTCKLDTGAEGNVMPLATWKDVNQQSRMLADGTWTQLDPPTVRMTAYGGAIIPQVGTCMIPVTYKDHTSQCMFHVTENTGPVLIGLPTCRELGLVTFNYAINVQQEMTHVQTDQTMHHKILKEYGDVFQGIGQFDGEYHIEVDPSVTPVIHPPRRVPHALREPLKQELDSLV